MRGRGRAAALEALLVLTACDLLQPTPDAALPIDELDAQPERIEAGELHSDATGPVTQAATGLVDGERFTLSVFDSPNGLCVAVERESSAGSACGVPALPRADEAFGLIAGGGVEQSANDMSGLVALDVDAVWAEIGGEERARAALINLEPAGVPAKVFIFFLPLGVAADALVAADASGAVIQRYDFGPIVPRADGADPTRAAP